MHMQVAQLLLGVVHLHLGAPGAEHRAVVALLAARLAVERSLVGEQQDVLPGGGLLHFAAVDHQRDDLALPLLGVVAAEPGGAAPLAHLEPTLFAGPYPVTLPRCTGDWPRVRPSRGPTGREH